VRVQVAISSGVGLFCGGTHFTLLTIATPFRRAACPPVTPDIRLGQPELRERLVEQTPAKSPGERAAGAVRALLAGREAADAPATRRIARMRHRARSTNRDAPPSALRGTPPAAGKAGRPAALEIWTGEMAGTK
jgi:hypothetical protein